MWRIIVVSMALGGCIEDTNVSSALQLSSSAPCSESIVYTYMHDNAAQSIDRVTASIDEDERRTLGMAIDYVTYTGIRTRTEPAPGDTFWTGIIGPDIYDGAPASKALVSGGGQPTSLFWIDDAELYMHNIEEDVASLSEAERFSIAQSMQGNVVATIKDGVFELWNGETNYSSYQLGSGYASGAVPQVAVNNGAIVAMAPFDDKLRYYAGLIGDAPNPQDWQEQVRSYALAIDADGQPVIAWEDGSPSLFVTTLGGDGATTLTRPVDPIEMHFKLTSANRGGLLVLDSDKQLHYLDYNSGAFDVMETFPVSGAANVLFNVSESGHVAVSWTDGATRYLRVKRFGGAWSGIHPVAEVLTNEALSDSPRYAQHMRENGMVLAALVRPGVSPPQAYLTEFDCPALDGGTPIDPNNPDGPNSAYGCASPLGIPLATLLVCLPLLCRRVR